MAGWDVTGMSFAVFVIFLYILRSTSSSPHTQVRTHLRHYLISNSYVIWSAKPKDSSEVPETAYDDPKKTKPENITEEICEKEAEK